MDQGTAPDPVGWSLRSRGPAHAASARCVDALAAAPPRGALARLVGADPLPPTARAHYRAALATRRAARILDRLGPAWRVLHDVPIGDANGTTIDHLVIGPPGVVTLTSDVDAAEPVARSASRLLSRATGGPIVVLPLVVPALLPGRLPRLLRDLPVAFGADVVAGVARIAEDWTTWRPFGVGHVAPGDPAPAFDALEAAVRGARRRRMLWASAGAIVLATAVILPIVL